MSTPGKPLSLMILSQRYKVLWMDQETKSIGACNGAMLKDSGVLSMDPDLPPTLMADVFQHEIIHALCKAFRLDEKKCEEEDIAAYISTGLCTVWQQNPRAFRWWISLMEV